MTSRLLPTRLNPIHNEEKSQYHPTISIVREWDMSHVKEKRPMNTPAEQPICMKICIHYRDQHSGPWATAIRDVHQIPQVGEFIAPAPIKVFRVIMTLHVLFDAD